MPLVDDKPPVRFGKLLRARQLPHFQAQGFAKLDAMFDIEYGFSAAIANVNMDRAMLVAVKEKPISVLFKNFRHRPIIFEFPNRVRIILLVGSSV